MMKFKHYLPMIAMAFSGTALAQGTGLHMENLDQSIAPGTDFYHFACGGWIKNNPLKPEYASYGTFNELNEKNREQIKGIITELSAQQNQPGSIAQKIGDLYAMLMDSTRQNKEGFSPLKADFKAIERAKTREQLLGLINSLGFKGAGSFISHYLEADLMNSKQNIVNIMQSGLTLGQKEYYVNNEETYTKIREAYKKHIVRMFQLIGEKPAVAQRKMESVIAIETRMAKASRSQTELRDPAANYNFMTYADFKREYAGYDWDGYFHTYFIDGLQNLSVGQPEALKEALAIYAETDLRALKDWVEWTLFVGNASNLGDEIYLANFDFFNRTMSGQQQPQPRWKRAVSTVSSLLGEAVGQEYVQRYFPAENKARMLQLVKNLQTALAERIDAQEWMSDSTKLYAKEKLSTFYVKIGYPDKWKDYSELAINPENNIYTTMEQARRWALKKDTEEKYNKPVDPTKWYMTPQTINAYYNPSTNEICFPAGILQPPFFDMNADDAFNYGAIGVVIGHEMTHGFDDQGRQFDKDGNFRDWWADGDGDKFKQRAQTIIDFFSNLNVLPNLKANGELTQGENLADHGGLQVAYTAFKNAQKQAAAEGKEPLRTADGFTPDQRFFIAYANVWAGNQSPEFIRDITTSDPHSLGIWRVNGALPHIDAWYQAFNIKESDPLFVPKDKRVTIW